MFRVIFQTILLSSQDKKETKMDGPIQALMDWYSQLLFQPDWWLLFSWILVTSEGTENLFRPTKMIMPVIHSLKIMLYYVDKSIFNFARSFDLIYFSTSYSINWKYFSS